MVNIKNIENINNGIAISAEKDTADQLVYIYTGSDYCPEKKNGVTIVELARGSYSSCMVVLPGKSTNYGAALDVAVDFLLENDVAFDHFRPEELPDEMDYFDSEGNVIDCVCAGNEAIYIPAYGININIHSSWNI